MPLPAPPEVWRECLYPSVHIFIAMLQHWSGIVKRKRNNNPGHFCSSNKNITQLELLDYCQEIRQLKSFMLFCHSFSPLVFPKHVPISGKEGKYHSWERAFHTDHAFTLSQWHSQKRGGTTDIPRGCGSQRVLHSVGGDATTAPNCENFGIFEYMGCMTSDPKALP